jgi:hypothetical protein
VSVRLWPVHEVRIEIDHHPGPTSPCPTRAGAARTPSTDEIDRAWGRLCAQNPRLHDGSVLSVREIDVRNSVATLRCSADTYKRLSVQVLGVPTGVEQLSVTGLLIARDAQGREHAMLGRRHRETRIYADRWELGPAGGVDIRAAIDLDALRAQLGEEMREEAGLTDGASRAGPIMLVRDTIACSLDVLMRVEMHEPVEALRALHAHQTHDRWEYDEILWLARDGAPETLADLDLIEPTRAILHALGWLP